MRTTAEHLTTVIHHWPDLVDALGGRSAPAWPPAGRMTDYLRALEEADDEQLHAQQLITTRDTTGRITGYRCAHCGDNDPGHTHLTGEDRNPAQIGKRPIPIRLPIHETMRIVQAALVECADAVAEHVQRAPISPPPPRRAAHARTRAERLVWEDHARRVEAAQQDRQDPRRWSWTGPRPGAVKTALWLLGRVQGAPGPFRPLTAPQLDHIATIARGCAHRIEDALDVGERRATLARPCPTCGGTLHLHGGAGALPVARCTSCGHVWSGQPAVA